METIKLKNHWTLDEALGLVRAIQQDSRKFGYHITLGGGVLNKGESRKDLDLFFLSLDNHKIKADPDGCMKWLTSLWGEGKKMWEQDPIVATVQPRLRHGDPHPDHPGSQFLFRSYSGQYDLFSSSNGESTFRIPLITADTQSPSPSYEEGPGTVWAHKLKFKYCDLRIDVFIGKGSLAPMESTQLTTESTDQGAVEVAPTSDPFSVVLDLETSPSDNWDSIPATMGSSPLTVSIPLTTSSGNDDPPTTYADIYRTIEPFWRSQPPTAPGNPLLIPQEPEGRRAPNWRVQAEAEANEDREWLRRLWSRPPTLRFNAAQPNISNGPSLSVPFTWSQDVQSNQPANPESNEGSGEAGDPETSPF